MIVPDGEPVIHTLEKGETVRVVHVRRESKLVEVDANGQRLIFSQKALKTHGTIVTTAG
jgi:hypothetical protein